MLPNDHDESDCDDDACDDDGEIDDDNDGDDDVGDNDDLMMMITMIFFSYSVLDCVLTVSSLING